MLKLKLHNLATSGEELIHWKRPWCLEGFGAGGEGDDIRWDGWMASPTQRTWVWVNSRNCRWTGRPGVLWFMGLQRVRHDWVTELNWTDTEWSSGFPYFLQIKSEFGNKEFLLWATISSQSCFCWLYRVSPSLAAKNIINLISVLTIWWCPCVESSLVLLEESVWYDQCVFLAKPLLAFVLLHLVLQGQICLLVSWLPTFAFQSPVMKRTFLGC